MGRSRVDNVTNRGAVHVQEAAEEALFLDFIEFVFCGGVVEAHGEGGGQGEHGGQGSGGNKARRRVSTNLPWALYAHHVSAY